MKLAVAVIGDTVEDAREWAEKYAPEPYVCFGAEDYEEGLRLIAAVITPKTNRSLISEELLSKWDRATVGYHTSVESELWQRAFAEVAS